ncbi:MAG: TetR/AcrR family transcriptional regulator [Calothrix sp. MO_192.B10]|nr:TetR/AcrR family transcriptional regulator [Calothrix sp. MO_192.B10]
MAGRKLEFDREQALEKAMELFWLQGYNATGLNDLLKHMGIQRQSLYNAFGSKHELFIEAITHYGKTIIRQVEEALNAPGSPLENIRNFLANIATKAANPNYRGCFVANSMMELAPHDPAVEEVTGMLARRVEQALERALERAVITGELTEKTNTREVARFLYNTILGLNVRGKASLARTSIDDILQVALSVLK